MGPRWVWMCRSLDYGGDPAFTLTPCAKPSWALSLLLLVLGMSPARTDDVSASDAVAQINAACSASRDVLVGVGGTIDGPVDLVSSPGRLASGSQGRTLSSTPRLAPTVP